MYINGQVLYILFHIFIFDNMNKTKIILEENDIPAEKSTITKIKEDYNEWKEDPDNEGKTMKEFLAENKTKS